MARTYPREIQSYTISSAERYLFDLFKKNLNDDYLVFHGIAWLSWGNEQYSFDGETDFLLVHPQKGLLVVEVKGGRITYDGHEGKWVTVDRNNISHLLRKDPVVQAKDARYNLIRKLRKSPKTQEYYYPIFHAISFPDIFVKNDFRLDLPKQIILDREKLGDIESSIDGIFEFWNRKFTSADLSDQAINALIDLIAPQTSLFSKLGREIIAEKEQIKHLTKQQFSTLDLLSRERRAIIFGCAGSGKTLLALEKARRLSEEGFSVLFTCFNSRLANWLEKNIENHNGFEIINFHQLCSKIAHRAGIRVPDIESEEVQGDEEYYFETILPESLYAAIEKIGPQYNAIIVDEGQDFRKGWWKNLLALLINQERDVFYIFCDDNQRIYSGKEIEYPFKSPSIVLNKNCRTTKKIHKQILKFYKGTIDIQAIGPEGIEPEFIIINTIKELNNCLVEKITSLISKEKVHPKDIVILTPKSRRNSFLKQGEKIGNCFLTWDQRKHKNEIECCSIYSFKGLESPIIFLVEISEKDFHEKENLFYVGVSRAINYLIVISLK